VPAPHTNFAAAKADAVGEERALVNQGGREAQWLLGSQDGSCCISTFQLAVSQSKELRYKRGSTQLEFAKGNHHYSVDRYCFTLYPRFSNGTIVP
jgi:hypothetical protein